MTDADKRINALIDRAGCPMMVVKNTEQKSFDDVRRSILRIADEKYDGSLIDYIRDLADKIDRLEGALENALNERDAAIDDLKSVDVDCKTCVHSNEYEETCLSNDCNCRYCIEACYCKTCTDDKSNYKWRGVPDKEESDA